MQQELQESPVGRMCVKGCMLLSLAWSADARPMGRIGWVAGDTVLHSLAISWDDLASVAKTGVIVHRREEGEILYELVSSDHDRLARVFRLLLATITDNAKIGVRAFNGVWTLAQF